MEGNGLPGASQAIARCLPRAELSLAKCGENEKQGLKPAAAQACMSWAEPFSQPPSFSSN